MKEADKSVSVTHVLVWAGWFMTSVHFGLSSTSIKKSLFPSSSSALAWDLSTRKKWQRRCSIPSSLSFNALLITCMSTVCKVALVLSYLLSVVFFSVVNAMLFLQYPWSFRIATVIIKVDLDCCLCSKKIKKALCKLQKQYKIRSIAFDEKDDTVTVSGPFNPDCFIKKLCCLASKVIKDIQIKPDDPPPEPEPAPPPPEPAPPPLEPPPPPAPEPPPPPAPEPPPPPAPEPPPPPKPDPTPPPDVVVKAPMWAFPTPMWPVCCYQPCPCYEPRYGSCRCCSCGRMTDEPPPPAMYYGGPPCYEPPGGCDSRVLPAAMETAKPRPGRYAPGWRCATDRSWRWRIMKLVSMRRRALRSQMAPLPLWSERAKLGVLPAPKQ
ncbi:hypothetical protein C4D60_Mb04t39530 [Musa balbisiana]|uniref:HMA domain-containing protein n=1 Tax=Musa balbisiana TaxID=52838 RepID=A0A4S8KI77_MUSBA|nr:hypothetical protein C4D60_Mb04t39530 [Musa balbisiana]